MGYVQYLASNDDDGVFVRSLWLLLKEFDPKNELISFSFVSHILATVAQFLKSAKKCNLESRTMFNCLKWLKSTFFEIFSN